MASEMLYPIMPIFLRSIGFSFALIGVLEGFAEAVAGLSKGYFGRWSDQAGKRLPFVRWGYTFSAISKPMMALSTLPYWIFAARTTDRLGKGVRTAARDAMLNDESTALNKGKIFGFHRSMDTLGAVTGPLLAVFFLWKFPGQYKALFIGAFLPGLAAILITYLIREKKLGRQQNIAAKWNFTFSYLKTSGIKYKKLIVGLLLFSLFNSSDVFLLLKMKEQGLSDTWVIGIYIFYNAVFALAALPLGILSDKLGMKKVLLSGLIVFVLVYAGFAFAGTFGIFIFLFFLYGIYAAATEGVSKAWISGLVPRQETATAIGTYTGMQSICALLASSLTGLLWTLVGSTTTFSFTAIATLIVIVYLYFAAEDYAPGLPPVKNL